MHLDASQTWAVSHTPVPDGAHQIVVENGKGKIRISIYLDGNTASVAMFQDGVLSDQLDSYLPPI